MKKYKTFFIEESKAQDAQELLENIRMEDMRELKARTDEDPLITINGSIHYSLNTGYCFTMRRNDGAIAGVFGVAKGAVEAAGTVWFIGTPILKTISREFIKKSNFWISKMMNKYPVIYNVVDTRNTMHVKFLSLMGFQFTATHLHMGNGETKFMEFMKIREDCQCASS